MSHSGPNEIISVDDAWAILDALDLDLDNETSSSLTTQRIRRKLSQFADHDIGAFVEFASTEQALAQPAAVVAQMAQERRLRRAVAPLIVFEQRLDNAVKEATIKAEMEHLERMDWDDLHYSQSQSESLGRRQAGAEMRMEMDEEENVKPVVTEMPMKGGNVSPQKRQVAEEPTSFSKRLRAAIPTFLHPPAPALPARAPRTLSTASTSTGGISRTHSMVSSVGSSLTLPPAPGHPSALSEEPVSMAYLPLGPLDESERFINITPPTRLQPFLDKCGVTWQVQWEVNCTLYRWNNPTWSGLTYDVLKQLGGPAVDCGPLIPAVLDAYRAQKRGSGSPAPAFRIAPIKAESSQMARIRMQADREEEDIASGALRGVGNDSLDWPYGGQIVYAFQLELADPMTAKEKRLSLSIPTPPSPDNQYRRSPTKTPATSRQTSFREDSSVSFFNQANGGKRRSRVKDITAFTARPIRAQMSGKSFRLARRFGSRRIVVIKLPRGVKAADLQNLLVGRVLIIFGRPFRALWASADGDNVFAVETNDELPNDPPRPGPGMPSLLEILDRYNDLAQKQNQAMAKWGARPQILFSDSVPVCRIPPDRVAILPDLVCATAKDPAEPSTEDLLTDGCGLMSEALSRQVYQFLSRIGLPPTCGRPSAIQMRFAGAKGMLLVMSPEQEKLYPGKDVILRDSMLKAYAKGPYAADPSSLTVDLVGWSSLKIDIGLSAEPMPIMVNQGVPKKVILDLQQQVLVEIRAAFDPQPATRMEDGGSVTVLETPEEAEKRLRDAVYHYGGVAAEVKRRNCAEAGLSQKVAGLRRTTGEIEVGDAGSEDISPLSSQGAVEKSAINCFDVDPTSGQPSSLAEVLYNALSSGFHPSRSAFMADKLKKLVEHLCDKIVSQFRLPVKESLSAYIVPDPTGTLAPNELFIAMDDPRPVDPVTQVPINFLLGEVLVLRSPCKLPTDVQKMVAVYKPELTHLRNVIVLSTNSELCTQSPASLLAGGDYDGDKASVYWNPLLVKDFTNADQSLAATPEGFVQDNFEKTLIKGTEVIAALQGADDETKIRSYQEFLLNGMGGDFIISRYSDLHGNAQYTLGVDHPETIRLGRMFCHVLDARKSGLKIKFLVEKADVEKYSGDLEWRYCKKGICGKDVEGNPRKPQRPKNLGKYIMDQLLEVGAKRKGEIMRQFTPDRSAYPQAEDDLNGLSDLFLTMRTHSATASPEHQQHLLRVEQHVRACHELWYAIHCQSLPAGTAPGGLSQVYDSYISTNSLGGPRTPRTPHTPGTGTEAAKRRDSGGADKTSRVRFMRELAVVWRDKLLADDVAALAYPVSAGAGMKGMGGAEPRWLREMKVSCGVNLLAAVDKYRSRQAFIFDVDFRTACDMRAERSGRGSVRILHPVWESTRPGRKTA